MYCFSCCKENHVYFLLKYISEPVFSYFYFSKGVAVILVMETQQIQIHPFVRKIFERCIYRCCLPVRALVRTALKKDS